MGFCRSRHRLDISQPRMVAVLSWPLLFSTRFTLSYFVTRGIPQAYYQIMQSMAHNTTLHQMGIFGKIESVNSFVLGDKFSAEPGRFTSRAGIGYTVLRGQRGHQTIAVLG